MFEFKLDNKGYIKNRESHELEFKQNFQRDEIVKYLKTLVGMANHKGGQIVFGIQDSPHLPLGMTNSKFRECDPKDIDNAIRDHFSHEIRWSSNIISYDGKEFGVLAVEEQEEKPVVCKKNRTGLLREGAIYYRYRGETKEIAYPELRRLLEKEREKERQFWIRNIERIAMIGPRHVQLLDTYKGELELGSQKILIDKGIIDKIKFIQEGNFTEKEGQGLPTLRLIGDVQGVDLEEMIVKPDALYPLTTSDLAERLQLNKYELQAVLYVNKVKDKPRFHTAIMHGGKKKIPIHKYSESLVAVLQRYLGVEGKLQECVTQYKAFCKERSLSRPRKKRK